MNIINKSSTKVDDLSSPPQKLRGFPQGTQRDTQPFEVSSGQLVPIEESPKYTLPDGSEWVPAWIGRENGLPAHPALGLCDITDRSSFGKFQDPETGRLVQGFRVGGKTRSGRQTRTVNQIIEDTPAMGVPNRQYHTGHHVHHQELPFARVTVYRDYMEVNRVQPAFSSNGGGLRSAIQGYSKKSYRNLQKKQAQVRANPSFHVTLTFSDYAPELSELYQYNPVERIWMPLSIEFMCVCAFIYGGFYIPYDVKFDGYDYEYGYRKDQILFGWELSQRFLHTFRKRLDRRFPDFGAIWKKEIQDRKRGANVTAYFIHYHLQMFQIKNVFLKSFERWCKTAWCQITDVFTRLSAVVKGYEYDVYNRFRYRVGVRVDRIHDHAHMSRYVAKYAAKESEDSFEIGRRWGEWNEHNLFTYPSQEYDLTLENYLDLRETVKRWALIEGRAKYKNFMMALQDDYNRGFFAFGLGDKPNDKNFEGQIYKVLDISSVDIWSKRKE